MFVFFKDIYSKSQLSLSDTAGVSFVKTPHSGRWKTHNVVKCYLVPGLAVSYPSMESTAFQYYSCTVGLQECATMGPGRWKN